MKGVLALADGANAAQGFNWSAIALAVTTSLAILGSLGGLIWKSLERRLGKVESISEEAKEAISNCIQKCVVYRAACREEIFGTFAQKGEMGSKTGEMREAVKELGIMLEGRLVETKGSIVEKIEILSRDGSEFRKEVLSLLRSHRHDPEGKVMFRGD